MLNSLLLQGARVMTEPMWLTVEQAAEIMGVTGAGVRRMCKYHQIKAQKFGRAWMIDRTSAETYVRTNMGRPRKVR